MNAKTVLARVIQRRVRRKRLRGIVKLWLTEQVKERRKARFAAKTAQVFAPSASRAAAAVTVANAASVCTSRRSNSVCGHAALIFL